MKNSVCFNCIKGLKLQAIISDGLDIDILRDVVLGTRWFPYHQTWHCDPEPWLFINQPVVSMTDWVTDGRREVLYTYGVRTNADARRGDLSSLWYTTERREPYLKPSLLSSLFSLIYLHTVREPLLFTESTYIHTDKNVRVYREYR